MDLDCLSENVSNSGLSGFFFLYSLILVNNLVYVVTRVYSLAVSDIHIHICQISKFLKFFYFSEWRKSHLIKDFNSLKLFYELYFHVKSI